MKATDKFGNAIYPKVFRMLQKIGKSLEINGWKESNSKPNLFYKDFGGVLVFADMRGTEEVPIWESPYPLVYAQKVAETWKNRRTLRHATEELDRIEVQFRFSFYHDFDIDEDDLNELETTRKRYGWEILADGSCHMCGEEFESDKLFCCERCEKAYAQLHELRSEEFKQSIKCTLCGKILDPFSKNTIQHHISYEPEKKIYVCRSCHRKIHSRHEKYPELAPEKSTREKSS